MEPASEIIGSTFPNDAIKTLFVHTQCYFHLDNQMVTIFSSCSAKRTIGSFRLPLPALLVPVWPSHPQCAYRTSNRALIFSGCRGRRAKFTRPQGGGRVSKMKSFWCIPSPEKKFGRSRGLRGDEHFCESKMRSHMNGPFAEHLVHHRSEGAVCPSLQE